MPVYNSINIIHMNEQVDKRRSVPPGERHGGVLVGWEGGQPRGGIGFVRRSFL